MKNQITIRRSGCFLPTFALVVIFLLVSALLWLSTVGLPQAATDYLTAKVKEETGLTLKVEKIRLAPLSGLGIKAEKVSLFEPGLPAVYIKKLKVSFDWDDVATGRFDLPHIRVRKGAVALAVGETTDELLSLKNLDLDVEVRSPQSSDQLHLNGACDLQGVNLKLTAIFPLQEKQKSANESSDVDIESSDVDIKATLADLKQDIRKQMPLLQQIQAETARQQWTTPPTLLLVYSAESTQPVINITANLPNFDWRDIHIHHAGLVAENNGGQLKLNRLEFKTSAPDTTFIAKAEFNPITMEGAFDLDSSASPVDIAKKHLQENTPAWLNMISHADGVTPHIRLKGDFRLAEDNKLLNRYTAYLKPNESANEPAEAEGTVSTDAMSGTAPLAQLLQIVKHLRIEGDIEQRGFSINDSAVNSIVTGFYFEDGNFNIDKLNIELPDGGNLALVASLKDGNGQVDFQLNGDIDYLLHFANHFTEVNLPNGLELKGTGRVSSRINLTMPDLVWGQAELPDMLPDIADIHLTVGIDQVKHRLVQLHDTPEEQDENDTPEYHDFLLTAPQLSLSADRIRIDRELLSRLSIEKLKCMAETADFRYTHTETVPQQKMHQQEEQGAAMRETSAFFHNLTLLADGCNLELSQMDGAPVFRVGSTHTHAKIIQVGYDTLTADNCDLTADLPYGAATNIAPLSQLKGTNLRFACKKLSDAEKQLNIEQPMVDLAVSTNDDANNPCYRINLTAALDSLQSDKLQIIGTQLRTTVENPNLSAIESMLADAPGNQRDGAFNICSLATVNKALYGFDELHIQFDNKEFALGNDFNSGNQTMSLHMVNTGKEDSVLNISFPVNGREMGGKVPFLSKNNTLSIKDAEITCPLVELQPLLNHFSPELCETITHNIELPKTVTLRLPKVTFNTAEARLTEANVKFTVPELVRTPNIVPAMRGKKVTVGVDTDLNFYHDDKGALLYNGKVKVNHASGLLDVTIKGNPASMVNVEGTNTIFADAIDLLLDNEDAHAIIRDFRFTPGRSKLLAKDIKTTVTYNNGICVDVYCDADLTDTEYLLGAYEDTEEGEVYAENVTAESFTLFKHAHCGVKVDVKLDRKVKGGVNGQQTISLPNVQTIELTKPVLTSNNRSWFTLQKMNSKGLEAETTIKGKSILFDIEKDTLTLNELKGAAYPAYTIGTFYLPLRDYLSGIMLTAPAQLDTSKCVIPIGSGCQIPMSGTIAVRIPRGGRYNLQGTIIPVEQFSGYVTLYDDCVYLDRLNSSTWGGVLNGQLRIGFNDKLPAFDGNFTGKAMNLQRIAKTFDADFKPAVCDAQFRFRAKNSDLNSLEGYGKASVSDGDLMEIPLFSPISYVLTELPDYLIDKATGSIDKASNYAQKSLKLRADEEDKKEEEGWWHSVVSFFTRPATDAVDFSANTASKAAGMAQKGASDYVPFANYITNYDLQDAKADFRIKNGYLFSDNLEVTGTNLGVKSELALRLADMNLNAALHLSFLSLLDTVTSPFTHIPLNMLIINVKGPIKDLSWKVHIHNTDAIIKEILKVKKKAKMIGSDLSPL